MNILIVDREEAVAGLLQSKLEAAGHKVRVEPSKDKAAEVVGSEEIDLIILDPTPMKDPRSTILNFRKGMASYTYVLWLAAEAKLEDALKSGANDVLLKPVDPEALEVKLRNAVHMMELVKRIGDGSEDFPSAGGVIAKSAFNQLFLSALERADRYGEQSYTLFFSIKNYKDILELDGSYAADYAAANLSQALVRLRRQSDILGQTAKHEYALLLQRPVYDTEPVEAANRFGQALAEAEDIVSSGATGVELSVTLVGLPVGEKVVEHNV